MPEGSFLSLGASVLRMTVLVESALIAHPDRVPVVVSGMCPRQILMTSLVHLSITSDVVVVTSESKSSLVAGNQLRNRKVPILTGRRTVNDNKIDATHFSN